MDSFEKYYTLAIVYISRRFRSEKEVRDYLTKRKASSNLIDQVIKKVKEQKFQDDEQFARWWKESRTRYKAKSDKVIELELQQKGIDKNIIEKIMNEEIEGMKNDYEKAMSLGRKYKSKIINLSRWDQYRRIGNFLSRRGFDFDTIRRVIDDIL